MMYSEKKDQLPKFQPFFQDLGPEVFSKKDVLAWGLQLY